MAFPRGLDDSLCSHVNQLHEGIPRKKAFTADEAQHGLDLCNQSIFQFYVEHFLFRLPRIFVFLRLARSAVADHFFNDGQFLSDRQNFRLSAHPVPALGHVRRVSQRRNIRIEQRIKPGSRTCCFALEENRQSSEQRFLNIYGIKSIVFCQLKAVFPFLESGFFVFRSNAYAPPGTIRI